MTPDPRLRLRVWVDGQLADETWLDASNPDCFKHIDATQVRHMTIVEQAERDGRVWLLESYDPAKPEHRAYTRIGTDRPGVVDPRPLP